MRSRFWNQIDPMTNLSFSPLILPNSQFTILPLLWICSLSVVANAGNKYTNFIGIYHPNGRKQKHLGFARDNIARVQERMRKKVAEMAAAANGGQNNADAAHNAPAAAQNNAPAAPAHHAPDVDHNVAPDAPDHNNAPDALVHNAPDVDHNAAPDAPDHNNALVS